MYHSLAQKLWLVQTKSVKLFKVLILFFIIVDIYIFIPKIPDDDPCFIVRTCIIAELIVKGCQSEIKYLPGIKRKNILFKKNEMIHQFYYRRATRRFPSKFLGEYMFFELYGD